MKTKIEWATRVWNPITGCTNTCSFCYARKFANRLKSHPNKAVANKYRLGFKPTVHHELFFEPRKWRKPERVFVCSMGEFFDPTLKGEVSLRLLNIMAEFTGKHTFMLLTRRADYMLDTITTFCRQNNIEQLPKNIWCGVSVSTQKEANTLIPILLNVPAQIKFVSIEPLTEKIRLLNMSREDVHHDFLDGSFIKGLKYPEVYRPEISKTPKLDWVIVGGMTGSNATPLHPDWVRELRNECFDSNTPFFFKSWGEYGIPETGVCYNNKIKIIDFETGEVCDNVSPKEYWHSLRYQDMVKLGKKHTGRLLDGHEYNQFPKI